MGAWIEPRTFGDLPPREQIDGLIWILGWVRHALFRSARPPTRFRTDFYRAAHFEFDEVLKIELVRSDYVVFRMLHTARLSMLARVDDERRQFALAAADEIQRAMDLLRARKAEIDAS